VVSLTNLSEVCHRNGLVRQEKLRWNLDPIKFINPPECGTYQYWDAPKILNTSRLQKIKPPKSLAKHFFSLFSFFRVFILGPFFEKDSQLKDCWSFREQSFCCYKRRGWEKPRISRIRKISEEWYPWNQLKKRKSAKNQPHSSSFPILSCSCEKRHLQQQT